MGDIPVAIAVVLAVIGAALLTMAWSAWHHGYGEPGNTAAVYKVVGGTVAGWLFLLLGVYEVFN
ncbi:MAG: hypothetical protein GY720_10820 [bacterium]|nr:hypothetical protein [bacterium]